MKTTCVQCGCEFESVGTLGEVIAEAQGVTSEQLGNLRTYSERFDAEHGGRGIWLGTMCFSATHHF